MNEKIKLILWVTIGLVCAILIGPADAASLTFGVYTSDKPTAMYRKFKPILDYLAGRLSRGELEVSIKIKIYPSYSAALNAIVNGDVDLARFGLYYCKMFLEDNGGLLNVSSSENSPGTVVRATFKINA